MIEGFNALNTAEFDTLKNGVSWVTLLIAGSDGNIDKAEKDWASKLAKIRTYAEPESLQSFYVEVEKDFQSNFSGWLNQLPTGTEERIVFLNDKIASLNPILSKLPNRLAFDLYKSFKTLANHIAKSSGGFLGFFSVSAEESRLIGLDSLTPILEEEE